MKTPSVDPFFNCTRATVHEPAERRVFMISIEARREPMLLARILTKLAVPDIELLKMQYAVAPDNELARCELLVRTTPARTDLTVAKLRKLVPVQSVESAEGADR